MEALSEYPNAPVTGLLELKDVLLFSRQYFAFFLAPYFTSCLYLKCLEVFFCFVSTTMLISVEYVASRFSSCFFGLSDKLKCLFCLCDQKFAHLAEIQLVFAAFLLLTPQKGKKCAIKKRENIKVLDLIHFEAEKHLILLMV